MAGIFTLGFIGGAAQAFTEAKRAEAEQIASEKEFERQKELYAFQAQENFKYDQAQTMLKYGLDKDIVKFRAETENEYAIDRMVREQGNAMAIRAYEEELKQVTDQKKRDDLLSKIDNLTIKANKAAEEGKSFVAPAGWTVYGYDNAQEESGKLTGAIPMAGVDTDLPMFNFKSKSGNTLYVPGVDVKYHKSDIAKVNQKIYNVADGIGTELWWHIENGDPHGLLKEVRTQLVQNIDKKAIRSNLLLNKDEAGTQYIQNPVTAFPALEMLTKNGQVDRKTQEWWIDNIIGPQLGVTTDALKEAIGYPKQLPLTYDEVNDQFVGASEDSYNWATEYVGMGSPNFDPDRSNSQQIRPEIWDKVTKIRAASGASAIRILETVSRAKEPEKLLSAIVNTQTVVKPLITRQNSGAIQINPAANDRLYKLVKNLEPQDGIEVARLFTRDDSPRKVTAVEISQGQTKAVYNKKFRDMYGISREDARARAYASKKAKTVILQMKDLMASGMVGAGKVSQVKKTLAGLGELVQDFNVLVTQISGEKNQEALSGIQKGLADIEQNPEISDSARLQYVFDLLGETLAYYQAAALQGGAQGRDISNQDVQFQREKLGLTGFSVYTPGVMANLDYLEDQMSSTYAIHNGYANAVDDAEFEAVFLYDQAMGGMAPKNYAEARSGAPQVFEGRGTIGYTGPLGSGEQYVERVINGETRRFPILQLQ